MLQLVTIGGYGYTEQSFFSALKSANVDTFVDIRQRRGMRGSKYAFLNSERLQTSLAKAGVRYVHAKALAPTTAVRSVQKAADCDGAVSKQARTELSKEFIDSYRREILAPFDANDFTALAGADAKVVALFCVEGRPEACHRSIVSMRFAADLRVPCQDLIP